MSPALPRRKVSQQVRGWDSLTDSQTTLVIYMARGSINEICSKLISHGLSPETPSVAVSNATLPHQQIVMADLIALGEAPNDLIPQQSHIPNSNCKKDTAIPTWRCSPSKLPIPCISYRRLSILVGIDLRFPIWAPLGSFFFNEAFTWQIKINPYGFWLPTTTTCC